MARAPRLGLVVVAGAAVAAVAVALATRARRMARAPADLGFMFAVHAAFRRDLARLVRAADQGDGGAPSPGVRAGFAVLAQQLRSHHDAEDDDLWPHLRQKLSDLEEIRRIDDMIAEHEQIGPVLEAAERAMAGDGALPAAARALADVVIAHLDHEEMRVLPLAARELTQGEWRRFLRTERAEHALRERLVFVAWVLDDAAPAHRAAVLRELPPTARAVVERVLSPRYASHALWSPVVTPPSATAPRPPRTVEVVLG